MLSALRNLDLLVLAIALPVFLAAGLPVEGWGATAAAWLVQRGIAHLAESRAKASDDPRTVAGLLAGSMLVRGWLMAGSIFAVGLGVEREAGLSAAILSIMLFTVYFTMGIAFRR